MLPSPEASLSQPCATAAQSSRQAAAHALHAAGILSLPVCQSIHVAGSCNTTLYDGGLSASACSLIGGAAGSVACILWRSTGSVEHANACVLQRSMVHASGSSPASRLIRQVASESAVFRCAGVSVVRNSFAAKLSLTTQSPGCCAAHRSSSLPTGQAVGSPHPQRWLPARLQQLVRRH